MKSIQELEQIRRDTLEKVNLRVEREQGTRIVVGMATCGIAAGARTVMMSLLEEARKRNLENVTITQTGCIGVCNLEPMIEVYRPGEEKVTYVELTPEKARKIIVDHVVNGSVVGAYTIGAMQR